jgi:hypothetical protein
LDTTGVEGENKMSKKFMMIIVLFMCIGLNTPVWAQDTGKIPVPAFTNVGIGTEITYGSGTGLYTYSYTISNPATNTGEIWSIDIDIRWPSHGQVLRDDGMTIDRGIKIQTFAEVLSKCKNHEPMVPIGISVPSGWAGSLMNRGFANFFSRSDFPKILPGETKAGFQLISRGLPAIRSIEIQPWWMMMRDEEANEESTTIGRATTKSLKYTTKTIGPTAPPMELNPIPFLDVIKGYIDECVTLGWLTDSTLASALKAKLDAARSSLQVDDDPSSAKVALSELMELINRSTSSQLTSEARGLLFYNVQYLKNELPDSSIPTVKTLSLTPDKATLPLGTTHTLTVTSKINGDPLPNYPVTVRVTSGPNEGLTLEGASRTDSNGQAVFTYTSTKVGTDTVLVQSIVIPASLPSSRGVMLAMNDMNEVISDADPALGVLLASNDSSAAYESMEASAEVTWSGGADLTIPLFIPPIIKSEGGNMIHITDRTENNGIATIAAGPSITRYYISDDDLIDPKTDIFLGERIVPALEVGGSSESIESEFQIPEDLPAGTYYCGACADADNTVAEIDELNNCANNKLAIVMPVELCGDFNDDGKVDAADGKMLTSRYKVCKGNAKYIEEADYDKDGCITFLDYREWYKCYLAFTNK